MNKPFARFVTIVLFVVTSAFLFWSLLFAAEQNNRHVVESGPAEQLILPPPNTTRAVANPPSIVLWPNGKTPTYHLVTSHAVMKYGKNQKLTKDFLKWLHGKEQFGKWFEVAEGFSVGSTKFWEQHPLWSSIDAPMKIYRQAAASSRMFGYAGPPSAKATEVYSKYILTDMFAKSVQGMKAEDAVKWAASELRKIYG